PRTAPSFPLLLVTAPSPPDTYTLSLHDALPICRAAGRAGRRPAAGRGLGRWDDRGAGPPAGRGRRGRARPAGGRRLRRAPVRPRSEEHTSELQSQSNLVCRLLLEKKNKSES